MTKLATIVVLAACGSAPALQPDAPIQPDASTIPDLSSSLAPIASRYQLPALAALASDGSQILGQGVTGIRKIGDPTPATLGDKWHLGSDTKAMTATLVAGFVEAGTLAWDEKLPALFPATTIDPGYANVTLAMLLAHVGGAPADFPADVASVIAGSGTSRALRLQAVEMMLARPPGAAVGTFTYSNSGYMMAGAALELATGQSWEDLITARLFVPLHMTSCGFGPNATGDAVDEPWGTEIDGATSVSVNADNPPALGPAGTVHCALADWTAFLGEHLHGTLGEPTVLGLQPATWTALHTPYAGSTYALGWIVVSGQTWANGLALSHEGDNTLNVADAWIAPGIHRIFVATSNRGDAPAMTAVNDAIVALVTRFAP
jgi:D-alanyl-D-alanine carboxypeptidase